MRMTPPASRGDSAGWVTPNWEEAELWDSNPRPLACHTGPPDRMKLPAVARYRIDLQRHSTGVARRRRKPAHVSSQPGSRGLPSRLSPPDHIGCWTSECDLNIVGP